MVAVVPGLVVAALPVWGQSASAGAEASSSASEVALMLLAVTVVVLGGGLLVRLLALLQSSFKLSLTAPLFALVSGGLWLLAAYLLPADYPKLLALLRFLLFLFILLSIVHPVQRFGIPARNRETRGALPPLLRGLVIAVFVFMASLALLRWSFPTLSLTPMFLTSGVLSIVLGLAVQDLLGNLLAGIVVSVEHPCRVGDWVQLGDTEGEVTAVSWRATHLRTRQNDLVVVPNRLVVSEKLTNFDRPSTLHLIKLNVGVAYETPPGLAVAALLEAASRTDGVLATPPPTCQFRDFQDSALLFQLRVWIDNYASLNIIESDLRKEIWYSLKHHEISIPFPQRDVNFRTIATLPQTAKARLATVGGPLRGAYFELAGEHFLIGRGDDCGLCIPDPHLSTHHAVIDRQGDDFHLRYLGHSHGCMLNGRPVREAKLRQGDILTAGPVSLRFEYNWIAKSPPPPPTPC